MANVTVPTPPVGGVGSAVLAGMTRYLPEGTTPTGFISSPAHDGSNVWGGTTAVGFSYALWGISYGAPLLTDVESFYVSIKPVVGQTWAGRVKVASFFGFLATGSAAWSEPNTAATGEWGYSRLDKSSMTSQELSQVAVSIAPIPDFTFETLPLINALYAYDETTEVLTVQINPNKYRAALAGTQTTTAALTGTQNTTAALTGTQTTTAALTGSAGDI